MRKTKIWFGILSLLILGACNSGTESKVDLEMISESLATTMSQTEGSIAYTAMSDQVQTAASSSHPSAATSESSKEQLVDIDQYPARVSPRPTK